MSFLEDLIRRFTAQRLVLEHAVALTAELDGIVAELGLGKGRTFDHLRERLPGRAIYAFDRELSCEPHLAPRPEHRVFGELRETLPPFCDRFAGRAALVHSDLGTRDPARDRRLVEFVARELERLVRPGAVVASDRPMPGPGWPALPLPGGAEWPYYLYRVA